MTFSWIRTGIGYELESKCCSKATDVNSTGAFAAQPTIQLIAEFDRRPTAQPATSAGWAASAISAISSTAAACRVPMWSPVTPQSAHAL
jgi:hypothetical protein